MKIDTKAFDWVIWRKLFESFEIFSHQGLRKLEHIFNLVETVYLMIIYEPYEPKYSQI